MYMHYGGNSVAPFSKESKIMTIKKLIKTIKKEKQVMENIKNRYYKQNEKCMYIFAFIIPKKKNCIKNI